MIEDDPFVAILRKHFPDADFDGQDWTRANAFMDDVKPFQVIDKKAQREALKALEKAIRAAETAYYQLDYHVKDALNCQHNQNMETLHEAAPGLSLMYSTATPIPKSLQYILMSLTHSLTGDITDQARHRTGTRRKFANKGAIEAAEEKIDELASLTGKAASEKTWHKAAIVRNAINCWQHYTGSEPGLFSKPFQSFLQDLADAMSEWTGEEWGARELVKTYQRRVEVPQTE